jgi:small subunit ribosomal protein S1
MDSIHETTENEALTEVTEEVTADESAGPTGEVIADEPTESTDEEQVGSAEMGELSVEDWDYQRPKRGEVRTGVILSIGDEEIVVDVDAKRDGIVPFADMQRMGEERLAKLSAGDEVDVYILRPEDQDGNLVVSLFQARQSQAWTEAAKLAETGEIWEGEVAGYNKGGLVVPVGEIRGFVPASQVPGFPRGLSQEDRLERLSTMVGETLKVKVIEINRRNRRLILSASVARREWRSKQRARLLDELREGEVRKGRVSSLCSFGAFVDLGGADGLVHLSELSWRRVRHPRETVRVGQEVEVFVLRLDREKKRIGLSLKRLQPEPWALVEDKYELGQLVEGVVTNAVDFGAFAEIEEGVEGLIHVSELTDQSISHPREVVKKGDLLLLRIIRIDVRRRRLGLSLKRVLESEWAEWAASRAVLLADEEEDAGIAGAEDAEIPETGPGEELAAPVAEDTAQSALAEPEGEDGPLAVGEIGEGDEPPTPAIAEIVIVPQGSSVIEDEHDVASATEPVAEAPGAEVVAPELDEPNAIDQAADGLEPDSIGY